MKIKQIKEITILANRFDIIWDKTHSGGSFSLGGETIEIGCKHIKTDPVYVMSIISHEVMECILAISGGRYESSREQGKYLFNFDHQTFENAIQLHAEAILKFLHN